MAPRSAPCLAGLQRVPYEGAGQRWRAPPERAETAFHLLKSGRMNCPLGSGRASSRAACGDTSRPTSATSCRRGGGCRRGGRTVPAACEQRRECLPRWHLLGCLRSVRRTGPPTDPWPRHDVGAGRHGLRGAPVAWWSQGTTEDGQLRQPATGTRNRVPPIAVRPLDRPHEDLRRRVPTSPELLPGDELHEDLTTGPTGCASRRSARLGLGRR